MDAKKALIRAEDMKKGVFSTIGQLPQEEPRKGSIAASAGARGHHVASHDGDCGCHGRTESPRPHALGGVDEHAEGAGGGNNFSRVDFCMRF